MGGRTIGRCSGRLWRDGQKRGLCASFQAQITQEIETLISRQALQDLDLAALETAARRAALRLAAHAIEQHLNQDQSDYQGPTLACSCSEEARAHYMGRRSKTVESVLGPLCLQRAYYHCSACSHGFFPRDRALQMEDASISPGVQRMLAMAAATTSFRESSVLLKELAGVELNPKRVERQAEAVGAEIAEDEKRHVEALDQAPLPSTLYLSMDGTGVPMRRSELRGREGKQPDGSAKTREVKVCAIWSAESKDAHGHPVRDEGSVSYSAAIESAAARDTDPRRSDFSERVLREITRRRFTQARTTAAVADLAGWIWNTTQELLPRTVQIADRWHVKEHLSNLGKAMYATDPSRFPSWTQRRFEELDSGRFPDLLRAVRRFVDHSDEARRCFQYLHANRERMRYPKFEADGLCTSSAVIEAGCKNVIGVRLKRSGMFWTVRGANAIIALRCCLLSGRFQDFWERRLDQATAA
jgi:hypothetical protein